TVDRRLVAQAGLEGRLVEAGQRGVLAERRYGVLAAGPGILVLEQHVKEAEEAVALDAVGHGGGAQRHLVERLVAEHQLGAAAVDPLRLYLRQGVAVERAAVPTGERGILDDGDRRGGIAENVVVREDFHLGRRGGQ